MQYEILTFVTAIFLILSTGCSTMEKIVYHPNINQGNYLAPNDILKIRIGMTQQQVVYVLGTPIISDPFSTNTWFYIFRQQLGQKFVSQQTLLLTFNSNGILTNIDNKVVLMK